MSSISCLVSTAILEPTTAPTEAPTVAPTLLTAAPSELPTAVPSSLPTASPTKNPTEVDKNKFSSFKFVSINPHKNSKIDDDDDDDDDDGLSPSAMRRSASKCNIILHFHIKVKYYTELLHKHAI